MESNQEVKIFQLRGKHKALEVKQLVFRKDPVFGNYGWCIESGNIVSEMQTMQWVDPLVTVHGELGQRGKVVGGKLVLEDLS